MKKSVLWIVFDVVLSAAFLTIGYQFGYSDGNMDGYVSGMQAKPAPAPDPDGEAARTWAMIGPMTRSLSQEAIRESVLEEGWPLDVTYLATAAADSLYAAAEGVFCSQFKENGKNTLEARARTVEIICEEASQVRAACERLVAEQTKAAEAAAKWSGKVAGMALAIKGLQTEADRVSLAADNLSAEFGPMPATGPSGGPIDQNPTPTGVGIGTPTAEFDLATEIPMPDPGRVPQ